MTAVAQPIVTRAVTEAVAVECPECCAQVGLDQAPVLHEILPCSDCGAELEIVAVDPPQVDLAPEVEEDWGE